MCAGKVGIGGSIEGPSSRWKASFSSNCCERGGEGGVRALGDHGLNDDEPRALIEPAVDLLVAEER